MPSFLGEEEEEAAFGTISIAVGQQRAAGRAANFKLAAFPGRGGGWREGDFGTTFGTTTIGKGQLA